MTEKIKHLTTDSRPWKQRVYNHYDENVKMLLINARSEEKQIKNVFIYRKIQSLTEAEYGSNNIINFR